MKIAAISNNNHQISHRAVNQEYFQRAQKEFASRKRVTGELLTCIRIDVFFKQIPAQDGIDTIEAIKKLTGKTNEFTEHVLDCLKAFKKETNQ